MIVSFGDERISIQEYSSWVGSLTLEDAKFLNTNLKNVIDMRSLGENSFRLTANSFVGRVVLRSGREIHIFPKVPVRSVLQMIARVLDAPLTILDEPIDCDDIEDGIEVIANWLASSAESVVSHGLMRRYIEVEEREPTIRGRIDLPKQSRVGPASQHKIHCRFSELTWNIPENQVIKQSIRVLLNLHLQKSTLDRLRTIDARLAELSNSQLVAGVIDGFVYDRSNERYRPLHRLCGLILRSFGITEDQGSETFSGFFINMNELFENFVTRLLQDRLGVSLRAQRPLALSYSPRLDSFPDLSFVVGGALALLGDCKYKRVEPEKHIHPDIYQVVTYCVAAGVSKGVLIYPKTELPLSDSIIIRNSEIVIRRMGIDLSLYGDALTLECDRLSTKVEELLKPPKSLQVA